MPRKAIGLKVTTDGKLLLDHFPSLESLQAAVGGYIEVVTLQPKLDMYVNEEGETLALMPNLLAHKLCEAFRQERCVMLTGDVVILRRKGSNCCSLTADDCIQIETILKKKIDNAI